MCASQCQLLQSPSPSLGNKMARSVVASIVLGTLLQGWCSHAVPTAAEMQGVPTTQFQDKTLMAPMDVKSIVAGDWPEMLPTALAQTQGTNGLQRADGTYVLEDSFGEPCVLAYFLATLTVYYPGDGKSRKSVRSSPPPDATVSGTCDRTAQQATLEVTWSLGTFILAFEYDEVLDSWYVDRFSFAYSLASPLFVDSVTEKEMLVSSPEGRRYWTTSHAQSFRCMLLHDITLTTEAEVRSSTSPTTDDDPSIFKNVATVHFDEVRVQAFTKGDKFKSPKHCIHRVRRDIRVPLIVGCTFAAMSLLTVAVYAMVRYYRIKKVEYDTMH